ncbi:MAG TPA: hypothetical protein VMW56_24960 [Candidatus Margulisiibacteriota bacterium]|nr:hypothetical protein [Candidatus Margulisiibacteriota bacterium]
MKFRHPCNVVAAVSVATVCAARLAWAGDMYSVTIVPEPGTTSPFAIGKVSKGVFTVGSNGSKIVIKPSTKAGDGGMTIQLTLKNVDCATYSGVDDPAGNNKGTPGKCGLVKTKTTPAMPARNHVLRVGANFQGQDFPDAAGILFQIENGVATFTQNGKNKVGGAALFGSLVGATFNSPLGLSIIKFQDAYRVCSSRPGCSASQPCAAGQPCIGGACEPLGDECSTSNDCLNPQMCYGGHCVAGVLCASDSDCTSPETCIGDICTGQTKDGSGVRCNLDADCADATPTCAEPGQVLACSTAPLTSTSPCFLGTLYAKTGIKVGCDTTLGTCQ